MTPSSWPQAGEVHLYALVLPSDPAELTRLDNTLTVGEIARGDALKSALARRRFLAGRGLLREILGSYLGIAAKLVQLATGEHGKPSLASGRETLRFNLAHSGELFLLAIAAEREVGIDLERIDPDKPVAAMAKLVFSPREQEQLSRLASPAREEAFYRYWVRKEACLKACGRGFSLPGDSFEPSPLNQPTAVMIACCHQHDWQIMDIEVAYGYSAALAVEVRGSSQAPPAVVRVDHPQSVR